MCGLVSIIARKPAGFYGSDLDLMEQMLILDQFRGKDSAGVLCGFRNGDQTIIKHATRHVTLMFETKDWRDLRGKAITSGRFLVGHNRAGTRGKATTENAHPFNEGRISLVHNGTIWNQKILAPDADVEVDSHSIAIALNTDTPENVIPKISGAFALIWYNNEEEKLHAVRNDERPLVLITTPNYYFLMSEPWMMMAPYGRQANREKVEDVTELKPGQLLTFDLQGKLESREVSLQEKKPAGGTSGATTTRDGYASWASGQQRKYHTATKAVVEAGKEASALGERKVQTDQELEDALPFAGGVTETPPDKEFQRLRTILTRSAQLKSEREKTHSRSCALTAVDEPLTQISTTSSGSNGSGKGSTTTAVCTPSDVERYVENCEAQQRNIIVENKEFQRGQFVLVKIWKTWWQGKFARWSGKVTMPGKPVMDAIGVLPEGVRPDNIAWMESQCTGKVKFCTYSSGGLSIFVDDLRLAGYCDVHGDDVPWVLWNAALLQGCDNCAGKLLDWERPYTVVRPRGVVTNSGTHNALRCVCPDCLLKALPDGEIRNAYAKGYFDAKSKHERRCAAEGRTPPARNTALQNRKPISEEVSRAHGGLIVLPGSTTLQ